MIKNYKVKDKVLKTNRTIGAIFSAGSLFLLIVFIYRGFKEGPSYSLFLGFFVTFIIGVLYSLFGRRCKLQITDDNRIVYNNGLSIADQLDSDLSSIKVLGYSRIRNAVQLVDEHYHGTKIDFVFEGIDDFLDFMARNKVIVKDIDEEEKEKDRIKKEADQRRKKEKERIKKKRLKDKNS